MAVSSKGNKLKKRTLRSKSGRFRPNDSKLKELILYIAEKSESDQHFGRTKLNKLLFYADFVAYGETGKSITGHEYQKLGNGPVLRKFLPITDEMKANMDCSEQEKRHFGYKQKRLIALREPDLSVFSGVEIAIVEDILKRLQPYGAKDVSELSHHFIGWEVFEVGGTIPYSTVFVSRRELTESEKEYGRKLEPTCVK